MHNRQKGNKGEDLACKFLEDKGYVIVVRNYLKKWGEIDIVANKQGSLHFVEVKSVIPKYSGGSDTHRPEDNVHGLKVRNIRRMIETYLEEKGIGEEVEFYFHVICVYMNSQKGKTQIKWIENVIL